MFLLYYVPHCYHCIAFMPVLEQVAYMLNGTKGLVFARVDVSKNDIDDKDSKSYPTLKFYSKNDKSKGIKYQDVRAISNIAQFLQQNSDAFY